MALPDLDKKEMKNKKTRQNYIASNAGEFGCTEPSFCFQMAKLIKGKE